MYLAFCRAASQLDDGARIARGHLIACRSNPVAPPPEPDKDTAKGDLKRALKLVNLIASVGWTWLLDALEEALNGPRFGGSWEAVSVIEQQTDRWERWGRDQARDLVLLVEGAGRVASLSAGEVEEEADPSEVTLATYRMENVHYYPAFNRMRPVTGRRVAVQTLRGPERYKQAVARFKPLLRTVRRARQIGESERLREFTPVGRPDGVKLWAFSGLLGGFGEPKAIPAPGAGVREEVYVPFTDRTGSVDLVFPSTVFRRSLQDFEMLGFRSEVNYMEDLATSQGPSLVVVGWPFGSSFLNGPMDRPTVVHWFPLPHEETLSAYEALVRVVSDRKASVANLQRDCPGWTALSNRTDVVSSDGWTYYVPAGLDRRLFGAWADGGMRGLDYMRANKEFGVPMQAVTGFLKGARRYFDFSPHERALYGSTDLEKAWEEVYPQLGRAPGEAPSVVSRASFPSPSSGGTPTASLVGCPLLQPDQILVHSAVFTRRGDGFVRVVSREKQETPTVKLKIKVVETYDPQTGLLIRTKEIWPAGAPESARVTTVLSRTKARVEDRGS